MPGCMPVSLLPELVLDQHLCVPFLGDLRKSRIRSRRWSSSYHLSSITIWNITNSYILYIIRGGALTQGIAHHLPIITRIMTEEIKPIQKRTLSGSEKALITVLVIMFSLYGLAKLTGGKQETPRPAIQNTDAITPQQEVADQVKLNRLLQKHASNTPPQAPVVSDAQKQLDDKMNFLIEKGMVTSYAFNEMENVVYVSSLWYQTPVTLKKDILASLSTLKEQARGNHRFEVRDANSNELVGEVTAFSGSIEVYK